MRALEWLLAAPWRLVLAVAIVVALPIVAVSEVSAQDSRERIRASELKLTEDAAARASDLVSTQLSEIRVQLTGAAANPNLKQALDERDTKALVARAQDLKSVMNRDARRLFVLDPFDVVLASEPDPTLVGTSFHDLRAKIARPASTFGALFFATYSSVFADETTGAPSVWIAATVTNRAAGAGSVVGTLIADVDLRFLRDWVAPMRTPTQDVYILDERGRLIGQASVARTETNPALFRDLSGQTLIAEGRSSGASSGEDQDPIAGARRLLGVASVGDPGWQVVLARDPNEVEREAGAALAQVQISRVVLVIVVLGAAYALGLAARVLIRQRATLAQTNAQLAKASQAKSQFLASVSHELRTPMNAILGFTDALLAGVDGPLNDEQRASLTWVQRGGQDLLALINEVLDLSKIESGKLVIAPETFLPRDLVESVCAQFRSLAAQKGLRLTWHDEGMPTEVHLDRQRSRQILVNLVGNALKFTTEGEVEIIGGGADGDLHLAVRDTGRGIPRDQLEAIFDDFRQVEGTVGGTGLGLAISRRLARLMGGDVGVTSEVGRGSTFTVVLPTDLRQPIAEAPAPGHSRTQRSLVLAVDDDPSVAPLLEKMLSDRGYDVVGATDAGTAVAEARRLHPNVITLDVLMPERDGRDVLADLRSDPLTKGIPIIVLTVIDKADVPTGADAHLMKPIRKDRLLRTLEQVVPVTIVGR